MSNFNELKVSLIGTVYWIESEIGMIFYDTLQERITLPSFVNLAFEDLELIINELNKIRDLIKEVK